MFHSLFSVPPEVSFRTPHRISQSRGREALLECFITAFPQAVSQWQKDNKPVTAQNTWKYRTEIYKEDHFTVALYLRITDLDWDDFGSYKCEASNRLGGDSDTMILDGRCPRVFFSSTIRRIRRAIILAPASASASASAYTSTKG